MQRCALDAEDYDLRRQKPQIAPLRGKFDLLGSVDPAPPPQPALQMGISEDAVWWAWQAGMLCLYPLLRSTLAPGIGPRAPSRLIPIAAMDLPSSLAPLAPTAEVDMALGAALLAWHQWRRTRTLAAWLPTVALYSQLLVAALLASSASPGLATGYLLLVAAGAVALPRAAVLARPAGAPLRWLSPAELAMLLAPGVTRARKAVAGLPPGKLMAGSNSGGGGDGGLGEVTELGEAVLLVVAGSAAAGVVAQWQTVCVS